MYLKELRAYGFKSFADKTIINFDNTINGIVGPNGSGKSNVVDAIRFVLGEQSIKSLRGDNNMGDVIFSGSKSRSPLNSAGVTLVFDNSDNFLNISFNEVSIKRVIYKNGENEYYLNNERCRLKDITELLTDTGASKASFNIISQGKIDSILSSKPEERRIIFEEAAGVLKYKRRKEEAIRKLERTDDNLRRINDIIGELNLSIGPLKEQSAKAKEYNEYKESLEDIEIALITTDIEKMNLEYLASTEKLEILNDEISKLSGDNAKDDVKLEELKSKLKLIEEELSFNQNKLLELTKESERINLEINVIKERNKYRENKSIIDDNIYNLKEKLIDLKQKIETINNEIDIKNKKLVDINNNIDNLEKKYNDIKKTNDKNETVLINNTRNENDYLYKIQKLEEMITNNELMPTAVKKILNNSRLDGVHDTIGNLIKTENKYVFAIDVSLMGSANYIVVNDEQKAKKCVTYLKENNIGRATFYPLNVIKPRYIPSDIIDLISLFDGYIDIASNLVEYDHKYDNIILNVLGNIIVVNNIDNANIISKEINYRYKIVTLDGQVINVGGSITGGNLINKNTSVIKEKYELDKLKYELGNLTNKNKELRIICNKTNEDLRKILDDITEHNRDKINIEEIINSKNVIYNDFKSEHDKLEKELKSLSDSSIKDDELFNSYQTVSKEIINIKKNIEILSIDRFNLKESIEEIEQESKKNLSNLSKKQKEITNLSISINRLDVKIDTLLMSLTNEYNMTFDNAKLKYKLDIDEEEARYKVNHLKEKIKNIGVVNLGAIAEFERVNTRYEFLTNQCEELLKAKAMLYSIIEEMDTIMKDKFIKSFNEIKEEFKVVFKELFKGGNCDLKLTNENNILETGIDIVASPPGKNLTSISLLSGGEKTFTAISLLFAILNVKPLPFCILDEVEAALDEVNVSSFGSYLEKYRGKTQFILITHKKKTMEYVDVLYGITMQESGVSKLVSVRLEEK